MKPLFYHLISCVCSELTDKEVRIRCMLIINDRVKEFKDPKIGNITQKIILVNSLGEEEEEGGDFGGVFRDALSSFWAEFSKGHAVGESEMVPCIRQNFSLQDWQLFLARLAAC